MKFYDAFHGIGGFRRGLEDAGLTCIGGCEIDKYACKAYGVINDEHCEPTDIRAIDPVRLPDFDCFVFGWPCQDNSIAGKRSGQRVGTRSGLLFEAARILRGKRPKYFIAENVTGLFSVNDGRDFYQTIRLFADLGYDCQWQVLNTRWFLPQNRERIFIVGHLGGQPRPEVFPITEAGFEIFGKYTNNSVIIAGMLELPGKDQWNRVYDPKGLAPTLTAIKGGRQEPKIIDDRQSEKFGGIKIYEESPTLRADRFGLKVYDGHFVRKLTPLECFRLQGFPDWWHHQLKEHGISDSQLYKMAGNAVSVPPAREIGKRLMKEGKT